MPPSQDKPLSPAVEQPGLPTSHDDSPVLTVEQADIQTSGDSAVGRLLLLTRVTADSDSSSEVVCLATAPTITAYELPGAGDGSEL